MFVPYLESVRGFAVVAIFVRHVWGLYGSPHVGIGFSLDPLVNQLNIGVDIFFVLSALVMTLSIEKRLHQPDYSYRSYLRARIWRIGPAYWFVLVLSLIFLVPTSIPESTVFSKVGLQNVLSFVFFMQTPNPVSFGVYSALSPFWTLSIEIILYLLLPFVLRKLTTIHPVAIISTGFAISIAWLFFVQYASGPLIHLLQNYSASCGQPRGYDFIKYYLSHQFPAYIFHFSVGIALAKLLIESKQRKGNPGTVRYQSSILIGSGIFVIVATMEILGNLSIKYQYFNALNYILLRSHQALTDFFFESIPYALGTGLVILGISYTSTNFKRRISPYWLTGTGKIGFSIYLIHMPILFALTKTTLFAKLASLPSRWLWLSILPTVTIWTLATLIYLAIEAPFQNYGKKPPKVSAREIFKSFRRRTGERLK